jgi:hypothetical protein
LKSRLPLVYVRTDDVINAEEVIQFIAGKDVKVAGVNLPETIGKTSDLQLPEGDIFYTSSECKSLAKLYKHMTDLERTVVFINTEKSVLQFDGGVLVPPKELVLEYLIEMGLDTAQAQELLPAFGGLTLKDVGEVAKMTMTRDESITVKGINQTRRGYSKMQGITQVDTEQSYYVKPPELEKWLDSIAPFFKDPKHPSLMPRGLLADGPPGTGKTAAAKAIAATFGVPLYRLDLGTMMGMYVGQSEGNLNAALAQVDEVEPCVIIFDEVEKVFRGVGDSGVTSRMLSQLLWWLQEHKSKVFTVMSTNDKTGIPTELYREGRIDKVMGFYGIHGAKDCFEFAKGAFDTMLAEMSAEAGQDDYAALQKRVNMLCSSGEPVPQVKLMQAVISLVRESLTGNIPTSDDAAEEPGDGKKSPVIKLGKKPLKQAA